MRIRVPAGLPVVLASLAVLVGCGGGGGGGDDDGALSLDIPGFTRVYRSFQGRIEDTNAQGYPEYTHDQTGIVFVRVPGGTFSMGSPEDEEGRDDDEGPVHEVTLSPFLIGKYELNWTELSRISSGYGNLRDYPVADVGWYNCQDFCRKAGLRLPSEAQWEYACRAGASGPYATNGWNASLSDRRLHMGGLLDPNGFGLYDMHGNVWEWCEDVYDAGFYSDEQSRVVDPINGWREDPFGPSYEDDKPWVVRGGGFDSDANDCRSASRGSWMIGGNRAIGFRPVYNIPQ